MNYIALEVKVKSAQVFKHTNYFSKLHLYAVVSIGSGVSHRTTVDRHGGAHPFWWFPMRFNIDGSKLSKYLTICIKNRRTISADKTIGQVRLPISDLVEQYYLYSDVAFTVFSKSGKASGVIYLSYMFCGIKPPWPWVCVVPSAPPLSITEEEDERSSNYIPSAPYLPPDYM